MSLEKNISTLFSVGYIVLSLLVLYTIYTDNLLYEFVYKVFSLLLLAVLYLTNSNKINVWYLLVIVFSILSDSLLIFGTDFRLEGTICLLLNRVFYIIIVKDVINEYSVKKLLMYSLPFLLTFILVFFLVYDTLGDLLIPSLVFGLLSVTLGVLAFLNYLDKNKPKNLHFFIGVFIIIIGDVLMTIAAFLGETLGYVLVYHFLYFIARYIIYKSMVVAKPRLII